MNLSDVSQTAVYTLVCRVNQAKKKNPIIKDPMATVCLDNMLALSSDENKKSILKWKKMIRTFGSSDAKTVAKRSVRMDEMVNEYIAKNPSCTIVSLGCGFDTRYWRIDNSKCKFIELDLPKAIEFKKEILKDHLDYEQILLFLLLELKI